MIKEHARSIGGGGVDLHIHVHQISCKKNHTHTNQQGFNAMRRNIMFRTKVCFAYFQIVS